MNLIGQQIDQYLIEAFIASGGMAEVYLARDVDLDRPVALKIMRLELARQEGFIARFQREARTIARLQHPNIVQIYSTGTTPNGQPYLAMQYVAGGTLQAQLERMTAQGQRLQPTAALQMMQQVAEALATAHAAGIIHRDLKPSNILLDSTYRPIVTDFGIAAVDTATTRLTQTGIVMGTPFYMSPEQIQGQGNVNGRSDIYTLGVILYELLAGRVPFLGPNTLALMHQHVYEPPPPLTEFAPHLTPTTIHLVNHCLAKEPEKRPLTAVVLSQSLSNAITAEQGGKVAPIPRPQASATPWPRYLLILLALLLLGFGGYQLFKPETTGTATVPAIAIATSTATVTETAVSPTNDTTTAATATLATTSTPTSEPSTATPTSEPSTATPTPIAAPTSASAPQTLPVPSDSPPNGRIVFTCYIDQVDDICSVNADGSDYRRLTNQNSTDFYASARSGEIFFTSRREGSFRLFHMNADGSNQASMPPTNIGSIFAPELSPDGSRLVFTVAAGNGQHIWAMDRATNSLTQLTFDGQDNLDPTWSPDGQQIAFASNREGGMERHVINADGTGLRKIATGVREQGGRSEWSPDGRWLAFYAGPSNDRDIYLAAVDGSVVYQLTDGGSNLAPSFSRDGNWLVFTSYREGDDAELYIMHPDGSDVRQITFNDYADWQPRWEK